MAISSSSSVDDVGRANAAGSPAVVPSSSFLPTLYNARSKAFVRNFFRNRPVALPGSVEIDLGDPDLGLGDPWRARADPSFGRGDPAGGLGGRDRVLGRLLRAPRDPDLGLGD